MGEITREQCPDCVAIKGSTSRNNLTVYDNGWANCMACGYKRPPRDNKSSNKEGVKMGMPLIAGYHTELKERGITLSTCQKYNVKTVMYTGYLSKDVKCEEELVKIFAIYQDGRVVKQKIKAVEEKHKQGITGDSKNLSLFGMNAFTPTKHMSVIVTEGEEDALAAFQMTGWPAVSVTRGADGAYKELVANLEWLAGFKDVKLCFDNDKPGREATSDCISIFEPGTVRNVTLPLKDANEMLLAGREEEFKKCVWNAEIIRPSTLVFAKDIRGKILTQPKFGTPFPWHSMTKATYGLRLGEIYLLAGPTSCGKTEFLRAIISQMISNECKVGVFSFEQQPEQTIQRFIGANLNRRLHIPGEEWNEEDINRELDKIEEMLALYNTGSAAVNIESVLINIRFLYRCYGIKFFVVDNLKSLAKNPQIEGKRVPVHEYASHCVSELGALCKELNINIMVVNHLSEDKISLQAYVSSSPKNPEEYLGRTAEGMQGYINRPGMTWETGRVASIQNIFGGGAIKDLTDYILVIARNRMSEDPDEHRTMRVKFLKTRLDSNFEGYEFRLQYDYKTGQLNEIFDQEVSNRDLDRDNIDKNKDTTALE